MLFSSNLMNISIFKLLTPLAFLTLHCSAIAASATVEIKPGKVIATDTGHRLLGSNIGLWYENQELEDLEKSSLYKQWAPSIIRFPGGSWSDEIYWNGTGVRKGTAFDLSKKQADGWDIDYSQWSPGFRINADQSLHEFHGHTTLPVLHQFAVDNKCEAIVTVNAGTGTAAMAAEWVRWANKKMGYNVKYWEVGNELEGEWEAGHIRPDGTKMDAKKYAAIYLEFAKAMKAVDPTIKVGGPTNSNDSVVFTEELIKQAGEHIDFISFHTYPVDGKNTNVAKIFKDSERVGKTVTQIRSWLEKYQPKRASEIEIGITEWHVQVHENDNTCNLLSGLWSARFIGEMFNSKVDFANQWDLFSTTETGGHGLFQKGGEITPRASYWAMWLWAQHLGETLTESKVTGSNDLKSYATMKDGKPAILLINQSPKESLTTTLVLPNGSKTIGQKIEFSYKNYLWNPYLQKPEWTTKPIESVVDLKKPIILPPFSATVLKIGVRAESSKIATGSAHPDIFLPESHPADLPLTTKFFLRNQDRSGPYLGKPVTVKFLVKGPAKISESEITMHNPVREITLTPTDAGVATIYMHCNGKTVSKQVTFKKVALSNRVLWSFGTDADVTTATGNLPTRRNGEARRNDSVLEVQFDKLSPVKGNDLAVEINPLSLPFHKEKIGGICAKLKISPELQDAHKGAAIQVVIQSEGNHWMVLKEIPFSSLTTSWQDIEITTDVQSELAVMPLSYALVMKVKSPKPLTGKLFVDDLGFILRN